MLYLVMLLMLQAAPSKRECVTEGGYFRDVDRSCLAREGQNETHRLLLKALAKAERELSMAIDFQQAYNDENSTVRRDRYNVRIAELEALRDATARRPAQVFQQEIDRLTGARDIEDSTEEFDPDVPGSKDSLRTTAGKLEPVISALTLGIVELKSELDASF